MAAPSREFCLLAKSRLSDALQSERRAMSQDTSYLSRSFPVLDTVGRSGRGCFKFNSASKGIRSRDRRLLARNAAPIDFTLRSCPLASTVAESCPHARRSESVLFWDLACLNSALLL